MRAGKETFDFILCCASGKMDIDSYMKLLKPRTAFCLVGLPAIDTPLTVRHYPALPAPIFDPVTACTCTLTRPASPPPAVQAVLNHHGGEKHRGVHDWGHHRHEGDAGLLCGAQVLPPGMQRIARNAPRRTAAHLRCCRNNTRPSHALPVHAGGGDRLRPRQLWLRPHPRELGTVPHGAQDRGLP